MHIHNIHLHSCSAHIAKQCMHLYTIPQVHRNTYTYVCFPILSHTSTCPFVHLCPQSHNIHAAGALVHPVTSPEAAASRPHLICTEGHVGCTWTHGHTCCSARWDHLHVPCIACGNVCAHSASRHRHTCLGSHLLSRTATHTPPLMQALPLPLPPDP